ncbi:unnamed protein product, partial [marine sediment metagenome]
MPRASYPATNPPQFGALAGWTVDHQPVRENRSPLPPALLEAPETDSTLDLRWRGRDIEDPYFLSTTFRHSGWVRSRRLVVEALCRTRQPESRKREFTNCGNHAYVLRSIDDPSVFRIAGSSCHDRFCLPCANERAHAIALNVSDHLRERQCRFLTLTLRSADEPLAELLDKLYRSFQALRRRAVWRKRVTGGVAFLEVKYNAAKDRWHPHFHMLLEGRYLPDTDIRRLWYQITGDSRIIFIKMVTSQLHATRYVTKYASKPFNNTFLARPNKLDEAVVAMKGRKLALTFGKW